MPDAEVINALTVDVEDYFQVTGFERDIPREHWERFESRVLRNTERVLELLAERDVHATFFILGWVAERFPALVRAIDAAGHEAGSHSYWHRLAYRLTPNEFRADLRQSRRVLEDLLGKRVSAFRAPSFSITRQSLWAYDILADEGFTLDSSVFPIRHDRYGIPHAPRAPFAIETPGGTVTEFPATALRLGKLNVPVSGGGYFRFLPYEITRQALATVNRRGGRPFVFYIHPWELDPCQPRLTTGTRLSRWRHYFNLTATYKRFARLLCEFRFGRLSDAVAHHAAGLPGGRLPMLRGPAWDQVARAIEFQA